MQRRRGGAVRARSSPPRARARRRVRGARTVAAAAATRPVLERRAARWPRSWRDRACERILGVRRAAPRWRRRRALRASRAARARREAGAAAAASSACLLASSPVRPPPLGAEMLARHAGRRVARPRRGGSAPATSFAASGIRTDRRRRERGRKVIESAARVPKPRRPTGQRRAAALPARRDLASPAAVSPRRLVPHAPQLRARLVGAIPLTRGRRKRRTAPRSRVGRAGRRQVFFAEARSHRFLELALDERRGRPATVRLVGASCIFGRNDRARALRARARSRADVVARRGCAPRPPTPPIAPRGCRGPSSRPIPLSSCAAAPAAPPNRPRTPSPRPDPSASLARTG